jgi:hypothetical protein
MISSAGVGLARAEEKKRRVGRTVVRKCMVGFLETRLLVWKFRWRDASAESPNAPPTPFLYTFFYHIQPLHSRNAFSSFLAFPSPFSAGEPALSPPQLLPSPPY